MCNGLVTGSGFVINKNKPRLSIFHLFHPKILHTSIPAPTALATLISLVSPLLVSAALPITTVWSRLSGGPCTV